VTVVEEGGAAGPGDGDGVGVGESVGVGVGVGDGDGDGDAVGVRAPVVASTLVVPPLIVPALVAAGDGVTPGEMPGKMMPGKMMPGKMMPPPITGITTGTPAPGTTVAAGVAEGVAAAHPPGLVIVSVAVETVEANAKALPVHVIVLPIVIPELSMSVPMNVEFAPSVVAAVGVQNISHAVAPPANLTAELATVVKAPVILKMYVPPPLRVIPPVPIEAAARAQ